VSAAAGVLLAKVWLVPADALVIERPTWMPVVKVQQESAEPPVLVREAVAVAEDPQPEENVAAAMLPATDLAAALTDSQQKITFAAEALIEAGIAEEIARDLVVAAERYRRGRDYLMAKGRPCAIEDYFFALWPDLGRLIKEGTIKPKLVPIPPESRVPRLMIYSTFNVTTHELSYVLGTSNWQMQFEFTEASNPLPELFPAILEAHPPSETKR
jgi:hypothetical protein